jgi:hypothetical protein
VRRLAPLLLIALPVFAQEIPVSDPTFTESTASAIAVGSSGDRFITVSTAANIGTPEGGVYASVIDLNGTLIRGPVTVSLTGYGPAISSGAQNSLIAWVDNNSAYVAIIDHDGNVSVPVRLLSVGRAIDVVWNGSRFLVLFPLYPSGVVGFLVDENGQPTSGPIPLSDWTAAATADGDGFLTFATVAVDQSHPEKGFTIQARRLASNGSLGAAMQTTTEVVTGTLPNFGAGGRVLFWEKDGVLHRVVTDSDGAPLSESIVATDAQNLFKVVKTASGTLLEFVPFTTPLTLMLVDPNGGVTERQTFLPGVDFAVIGTRALLVTHRPLRGYLADIDGRIQIGPLINVGRISVNQYFPQVASDGSMLLAAWFEFSTAQVFAARIDPVTRKHLAGRGLLIASQAYFVAPAVAPLGDGFVVAYLEVSSGVSHLWIRRVLADGVLDGAPTLISTTSEPYPPRLASDGNQALLVWTENTYNVRGTRIDADGTILDPAFLKISDGDNLPLQWAPDVSIDGSDYMVAWQAQRNVGAQFGMSAVHVTQAGIVLDPPDQLPPGISARVAGNAVAASTGSSVIVNLLGEPPIDLGPDSRLGDIEQFLGGFLLVAADFTGIEATEIARGTIVNRFTIPLQAGANQVSSTTTASGVELAYTRATGDEGYGGSLRAYVLPLNERRRRPTTLAR